MIERIWHGYSTPENADVYENLLKSEIIPGIAAKSIPGYKSIRVLRRNVGNEVEFITIMRFESLDSIIAFVGESYEVAHVPEKARAVLKRFDGHSQHYELRDEIEY